MRFFPREKGKTAFVEGFSLKKAVSPFSRGKNRISHGVENRGSLISVPLALRAKMVVVVVGPSLTKGRRTTQKTPTQIKTVCTNSFCLFSAYFKGKRGGQFVQTVPPLFAQIVFSFRWLVFWMRLPFMIHL